MKKDARFVQVMGQVVAGSVGLSSTRPKKASVPSTVSNLSSPTNGISGGESRVAVSLMTAPDQLNLFFPNSEQYSLLARWTSMGKDLECSSITAREDSCWFQNRIVYIQQYIGTSPALDNAVQCYLHCKLVIASPTGSTLLALQTSKIKALSSVRSALERRESRLVQTNILLAVQLLYMVEVGQ